MRPRIPDLPHLIRSAAPSADLVPDGELLAEFVAARSGIAFELLVRRHGPAVWAVCRRHLSNTHDAEDAFQAAFLVLARSANTIAGTGSVGAWLYGVAYRVALKARQSAARRRKYETRVAPTTEPSSPPVEPSFDLTAVVHAELERLPERYRLPLLLCDLEGLSRKEASGQLGWKEGTLSGRLNRARKLLADRLSARGVAAGVLAGVVATAPPTQATVAAVVGVGLSCMETTLAAPGTVAALAKGAMRDMTRTFILKVTAAVLVVAAVLGGGLLGLRTEPAAVAAPVPKDDRVKPDDVTDDCLTLIRLALVQRELKLSAETRVKLIDGFDDLDQELEKALTRVIEPPAGEGGMPSVIHTVGTAVGRKIDKARRELVADSLTRTQVNRVRQIGVQVLGLYALNAPWVADELALPADQKKEVVKVLKAVQQEQYDRQAMTQMVQPPAETQADYHAKCDEKLADLLNGLSASQQRKWKELAGEKMSLDRKRAVPYFYELFAKYTPKAHPRPGLKGTGPANDDDSRELPPPLLPAGPQPAVPPVMPDGPPGGLLPPPAGLPPPTIPPPVRR